MTGFWESDLGALTGNAEDAFSKSFSMIPDGTMALSRIVEFKNDTYNGIRTYKIDWLLLEGEYKGQHTFQKIKAFDTDPKKRHTSLNMLVLLFKLFGIAKPTSGLPPSDQELMAFIGKTAGIKVRETDPNDEGKVYNFVSEVHPSEGFKSVTGERKIVASKTVSHAQSDESLDSALTRNSRKQLVEDDIPW